MTPEEKAAHDALIKELKSMIEEAQKNKADVTKITELETKLKTLEEKEVAPKDYQTVKEEVIRLATELKALKETPKVTEKMYPTRLAAIKAALDENIDAIKGALDGKGNLKSPILIEMKSAVTMQEDNTIGAGSTQYTITTNTGIISTIRKRAEVYLAAVSVGSLTGNQALWIEEVDEQGDPIMIGEGDGATQLSVRYEEKTKDVKEISVYGKVTNRMLEDLPMLASYINNNLEKRMDIKVEDQLLSGNDTGDNLKGLEGYATAFDAGDLANSIEKANEIDVIEAIGLQVKNAYGIASGLFINPTTMAKIKLIKDTTGRPVWKDYVTISGEMVISGMKIIETAAVDAGDFLGGDLSVANVLFRQNTTLQIGTDGNDLIQRKKTIVYTKRLVQFVSANETAVLVKGDFATAKAALLTT